MKYNHFIPLTLKKENEKGKHTQDIVQPRLLKVAEPLSKGIYC